MHPVYALYFLYFMYFDTWKQLDSPWYEKTNQQRFQLRDGPLENLWGAGEVQKKYSRKAKLNEKKFMHAN